MLENTTPDPVRAACRLHRRRFLQHSGGGLGIIALASLLGRPADAASPGGSLPGLPHFAAPAKRVVFLHQSGAPSQLDLFDPKPLLAERHGQELPESVRKGQRLTGMTSDQETKPLTASLFKFARPGPSGAQLSELLPHTSGVADDLCIIRSMHTEAINHDPAITFIQTGSQQPGRPSMGAWVSYALGNENANLPTFVLLLSGGIPGDQPLFGRLWGAGFLSSRHQGVKFRGSGDPVLYLSNPAGLSAAARRRMLRSVARLNGIQARQLGDPEIDARTDQYEVAGGMQLSVPELVDVASEPGPIKELYGPEVEKNGSFARNCLLARRMVERGVRFIQIFHRGWDHHTILPKQLPGQCFDVDQPSAALLTDLKQRGLLEDTIVVFAGEFGRTVYCQGKLERDDYGRDHHPRCFSGWVAGGGIRGGIMYGKTDDFSYNVVEDPVAVRDLHATILHQLGINHEKLTFPFQGLDQRLTGVEPARVVREILV